MRDYSLFIRLNDILLSWSFPGLQLVVGFSFIFLIAAFSSKRPVKEWLGVVLPAHFLVINTISWNGFIMTYYSEGGETIFRYGFTPVLPACSFYGGLLFICLGLGFLGAFILRIRDYSWAQRIAFPLSIITIIVGLIVSLRTPIQFQKLIDSLDLLNSVLISD